MGGREADGRPCDALTDARRTERTDGRTVFFPDNKGGYGPAGQSRTIAQGGAAFPSPCSVPLKANAKTSLVVAAIGMARVPDRPIRNLTLLCHPDAMHATHGTERQENM